MVNFKNSCYFLLHQCKKGEITLRDSWGVDPPEETVKVVIGCRGYEGC